MSDIIASAEPQTRPATPLSEQQLAEIRERANAATRGPWGMYDDIAGRIDIAADLKETPYGYSCRRGIAQVNEEPVDNDPEHAGWDGTDDQAQCIADAVFIAAARMDVPALAAEVERLTAELAKYVGHEPTLAEEAQYRYDAQVRYAAALEASICRCKPQCEGGEYLHAADCPVVPIQMQAFDAEGGAR